MPSAIGQVIPALTTVLTTALAAQTGTLVFTGPKPTADYAQEYLTVGFDPSGDGPGVDSDQRVSALGNRWIDESGDITCSITCWSGDDDTAPMLARADIILDIVDAALAANPTLSGVLVGGADDGSYARVLGKASYAPAVGTDGAIVRLTFTIHYSTLLT